MIDAFVQFYVAVVDPYLWPLLKLVIFFLVVMAVIWMISYMRELDNVVLMARRTMSFTYKFTVGTCVILWKVVAYTAKLLWRFVRAIVVTIVSFFKSDAT